MGMYESFAQVYDAFMDDAPYEEWSSRLIRMMRERGIKDGLVLDLGCGTGTVTELLAQAGYDMIGVDLSEEMLRIAQEKRLQSGHDILYLEQDMRSFELYGTVRAVVSVCDSINYITDKEDLLQVFRLVNNYLDPGGLFLFDLNTRYKYETLLGDQTFADSRPECSYIWENTYFEEERINEYDLTLFHLQENGLYRRFTETHFQRAYDPEEIKQMLSRAGLRFVEMLDADTGEAPGPETGRLLFAALETGKMAVS